MRESWHTVDSGAQRVGILGTATSTQVFCSLIAGNAAIGPRLCCRFEETNDFFSPVTLDCDREVFRNSLAARNLRPGKLPSVTLAG